MATNQTSKKPASKNKNFVMIGVLLLLIGVGGSYQFLSPQLKAQRQILEAENAKLKGLETEVQVLTNAKNQLAQAQELMRTNKNVDFDKVPFVYPATEDVPGLYLQLEALMADALGRGIKTPVYQVGAPAQEVVGGAVKIPIAIAAVGSYSQLREFVARLETNLRPISIQTINFAQSLDKEKAIPTGEFTLNIAGIVQAASLSPAYAK